MNCEKCQELLSDFLDGKLKDEEHSSMSAHLEECLSCYGTHGELDAIVSFCREHRGEYTTPPNEQALWVRIRNSIEIESGATALAAARSLPPNPRQSLWSRVVNRSWELSLPQMTAAVSAIAIAVALATAFSVHRMQGDTARTNEGGNGAGHGGFKPATLAVYNPDDQIRQQQIAIEYWNQRVEQHKVRWNPQLRDAFERNMRVIDQTVEDSRQVLIQNPHDEVYEEMLNTALNDKMELLKEFSDM